MFISAILVRQSLSRKYQCHRAFVVHGAFGWDEATPCGPFVLFDVRPEDVQRIIDETVIGGQILEDLLIPDQLLNTKGGRVPLETDEAPPDARGA